MLQYFNIAAPISNLGFCLLQRFNFQLCTPVLLYILHIMYKCAVWCKLYKRQEIFASKLFLTSTKRRAALPLIIHCHRHQRKKNCAEKCKLRREKILRDNRIIIKSFPVAPREQWNCWPHKRREAEKLQKNWNCSSSSKLFGGIWRLSLPGIVTTPKIVTIVPSVPENKLDEIIAEVHSTVNIIWMH